jgi:hypothetical protein
MKVSIDQRKAEVMGFTESASELCKVKGLILKQDRIEHHGCQLSITRARP